MSGSIPAGISPFAVSPPAPPPEPDRPPGGPGTMDGLRHAVAGLLPEALTRATASYRAFVATDPEVGQAKDFKEHHAAGRTALAHIELMLRLARWAVGEPAGDPSARSRDKGDGTAGRSGAPDREEGRAAEDDGEPALAALVADARRVIAALAAAEGEPGESPEDAAGDDEETDLLATEPWTRSPDRVKRPEAASTSTHSIVLNQRQPGLVLATRQAL